MAIKICECGWTMQRINGVWFCADCDRKPKECQPEIDLDKIFAAWRAWLKTAHQEYRDANRNTGL
jgi:hypothetical protein